MTVELYLFAEDQESEVNQITDEDADPDLHKAEQCANDYANPETWGDAGLVLTENRQHNNDHTGYHSYCRVG